MTQLMEFIGWLVFLIAVVLALILGATLCISLLAPFFGSSTDPHGFGLVLPLVGLLLFATPGMLAGWCLIKYAQRQRGYRKAI